MRKPGSRAARAIGAAVAVLLAVVIGAGLGGCEKPTHENLDKWMRTQKGPGKIRKALRDDGLAPALRAHAARNLIRMDETIEVADTLGEMDESVREPIVAELATRLWDDARVTGDEVGGDQIAAKDALFEVRPLADQSTRERIDQYLLDWLGRGYYYEELARMGQHGGADILRAIGPGAGPTMIKSANVLLGARDPEGKKLLVGPNLLLGLAVTGDPDAVGLVLDMVDTDRDDADLPERAMAALHDAYVSPKPPREAAEPKALEPHLERLVELLKDESQPVTIINAVLGLLAAVGMPACLEPLVDMVSYPHSNEDYRWVGLDNAFHCGKVDAIVPVAEALPSTAGYEGEFLRRVVWTRMVEAGEADAVAERARTLLESDGWLARVTGVELLGMLKLADSAAEDAERVARLGRDKTVLKGWWGDQSELPRAERKSVPTLGQRAREVAKSLQELAPEAQKQ